MGKKMSTLAYSKKDEMEPIQGGETGNVDTTYVNLREIMTVTDVAEFLRCDPSTVYNWIRSGQLSAVCVGTRFVRVKKIHLIDFLEGSVA